MVSENGEFRIHAASDDGTSWVQSKAFMIKHATGALHGSQVRHSIRPTLNLDFANSKELDPRIEFSRDSIGTYYDSKGLLSYATHNEPRFDHDPDTGESKGLLIEEERRNVIESSAVLTTVNSPWALPSNTSYKNNALSPDGRYNATAVTSQYSSSGENRPAHGQTLENISYDTIRTVSIYAKQGSFPGIQVRNTSRGGTFSYNIVNFNLTDGTVYNNSFFQTSNRDHVITPVGNGWYRCSVTCSFDNSNVVSSTLEFAPFDGSSHTTVGDGLESIYVFGAQIEEGAFPTSFIPSDLRFVSRGSAATYFDKDGFFHEALANTPRYNYEYDGRNWIDAGLLLEPAATNLTVNFWNFVNGTTRWSTNQRAETERAPTIQAPDGSYDTVKLVINDNSTTAGKSIYRNSAGTAGGQRCVSVYAKAAEHDRIYMYFDGTTPTGGGVYYDLSNGTISGGPIQSYDAYGIDDVGNGWYRCWFSGTVTGSQAQYYWHIDLTDPGTNNNAFNGTIGEGVYLYAPQMEYSGVPTSYIYTQGSSVSRGADVATSTAYTRKADVAQMNGKDKIEEWYVPGQGTLYAEGISNDQDTYYPGFIELNKNSSGTTDRIQLLGRPSGIISFQVSVDGSFSAINSALSGNMRTQNAKVALAFQENDFAFTFSGNTTVYTDTSGPVPDVNYVSIGEQNEGYMNGTIKKIVYYPERLTNDEIVALTEND
jgi:hypothetical protein